MTGVSGTSGYGTTEFRPTQLADVLSSYSSGAGQLTVDLSKITIPKGSTKTVAVDLKGGNAEVIVPANTNVVANCDARVGRADCLGQTNDGLGAHATSTSGADPGTGTLNVTVRVNAGFARVTDHA